MKNLLAYIKKQIAVAGISGFIKLNLGLVASPILFVAYWFLPVYAPKFLGWSFLISGVGLVFGDFLNHAVVDIRKSLEKKGLSTEVLAESGQLVEVNEEKRQEALKKLRKGLAVIWITNLVSLPLWVALVYRVGTFFPGLPMVTIALYISASLFMGVYLTVVTYVSVWNSSKSIAHFAYRMSKAKGLATKLGGILIAIHILF